MSWYRGRWTTGKRSLMDWMAESKKDYHFRVRNKNKADTSVITFAFSDKIKKDRRLYCASALLYANYQEFCQQQGTTPLNNHEFKWNNRSCQ